MRIVVMFVLALFVVTCTNSVEEKKPKINITEFLKDQVLLTNEAYYTKDRALYGASAFLVNYGNEVYAITARHLLGESGGIQPEIDQMDLPNSLLDWKMYPRVPVDTLLDTVRVRTSGFYLSNPQKDVLVLKVINKDYKIKVFEPAERLPEKGEKCFIIGCPYSEEDCRQNSYEVVFGGLTVVESALIFKINENLDLSGFSGAPVINAEGKVLGVVNSGSFFFKGKKTIYATSIIKNQEIQYLTK